MKIPADVPARYSLYQDLMRDCVATRSDRRRAYAAWRNYYLYGADGTTRNEARYNKIYPHIDTTTSFLYSQETTRFSVQLAANISQLEMRKVPAVNRAINDEWMNSNTDIVFGNALTWSFVYGSMFIKPRWRVDGIEPFVVDPHNFGVLREDSPGIHSQEAFCHTYYISKGQLAAELDAARHPQRERIMNAVTATQKANITDTTPMDRIITSASSPMVTGNVNMQLSVRTQYAPRVSHELVEMCELYVWNDDTQDYQIVTLADPMEVVYDRPLDGMFLKDDAPFIQICPIPTYDYFFGYSEVERLTSVQDAISDRWDEITHMMALQAHPPKNFSGFPGITDEIALAFDSPNGQVNSEMPGAKVDNMAPDIPNDLFREIDRLEQMFEDISGINGVMQGKGEQGVRSSGHASQLARLGSSRIKKRALIVEDSLEKLATLYLKIKRKYDKTRLRAQGEKDERGDQFILDQFTAQCVVRVDAHSNSPIFNEDQTQLAFELFKAGSITKERLLELVAVPMRQQLLFDLKDRIEPAEQAKAEQERQDKIMELNAHRGGRHGA